jgi:sulfite dehydrogenase
MNSTHMRWIILCALLGLLVSCQPRAGKNAAKDNSDSTKNILVSAPGKRPLILLTDRPPNLETPLKYFLEDFTPNDVFFVRWHLANLPAKVDPDTFRLWIGGNVNKELRLSMNDLKTKFKPFTVNALCLCAGNSRSSFHPRVPGAQWANGGMGNAKWTGARLKDVLDAAGIRADSRFISFNGLDGPPLPGTPDFVKSLTYDRCMDGEIIIAYEMNGDTIPWLNGYPLKLVVPGWYATYWMGMLSEIRAYADTFKGFWMDKAYQVPKGVANGNERPDSLAKKTVPITKIDVRSIFVSPGPDSILAVGGSVDIQGLAFDGGDGITGVEISTDSGRVWMPARLDASLGPYSWRRWHFTFRPSAAGSYKFYAKATNAKGETQPWHQWNRSGYMRNEIETLELKVQ